MLRSSLAQWTSSDSRWPPPPPPPPNANHLAIHGLLGGGPGRRERTPVRAAQRLVATLVAVAHGARLNGRPSRLAYRTHFGWASPAQIRRSLPVMVELRAPHAQPMAGPLKWRRPQSQVRRHDDDDDICVCVTSAG
jgi:hypothetical protein